MGQLRQTSRTAHSSLRRGVKCAAKTWFILAWLLFMIFRQSLTKLQRLLLWFYSKKVAILFGWKKAFNSWGLILLWVLFAVCEVCASVRSPSRSSGHLSVAVQWCVQCCTAQYSAGYSQGSVSSPSLRSDSAVSWTGVTREKSFAELMWMETHFFDLVVLADKCYLV